MRITGQVRPGADFAVLKLPLHHVNLAQKYALEVELPSRMIIIMNHPGKPTKSARLAPKPAFAAAVSHFGKPKTPVL